MDQDRPGRPRLVSSGGEQSVDTRVAAVLEVLAGRSVPDVARHRDVDTMVLHRWVRDFVEAGDRDRMMSQMAAHAANAHGISEITPDVRRTVESKITIVA